MVESWPGMKLLEDFSPRWIFTSISRWTFAARNFEALLNDERKGWWSHWRTIRLHSNHFVDTLRRFIAGDVNRALRIPFIYWQPSTYTRMDMFRPWANTTNESSSWQDQTRDSLIILRHRYHILGWCIWNVVSAGFEFDGPLNFVLTSIIKHITEECIRRKWRIFNARKTYNRIVRSLLLTVMNNWNLSRWLKRSVYHLFYFRKYIEIFPISRVFHAK